MPSSKRKNDANDEMPRKRGRRAKQIRPIILQNSPLLRLPAELRVMILEMAFEEVAITWPKEISATGSEVRARQPALMFVCRQISSEALKLCYANATFAFGSPDSAVKWMDKVRPELAKLIRYKVVFLTMSTPNWKEFDQARRLSWDREFRRMIILRRSSPTSQRSQFLYRLEYNPDGNRQLRSPSWPDDILFSHGESARAHWRLNTKILKEIIAKTSKRSHAKTPDDPTKDKLGQAKFNKHPHSIHTLS